MPECISDTNIPYLCDSDTAQTHYADLTNLCDSDTAQIHSMSDHISDTDLMHLCNSNSNTTHIYLIRLNIYEIPIWLKHISSGWWSLETSTSIRVMVEFRDIHLDPSQALRCMVGDSSFG